jgi:hypothetical protein
MNDTNSHTNHEDNEDLSTSSSSYHDEPIALLLNDADESINVDELEGRENVRRQYRRRLTLDPLAEEFVGEEIRRLSHEEDGSNNVNDDNEALEEEMASDDFLEALYGRHLHRLAHQEDDSEPPRPARDHGYLPTAQPLYPEEWVRTGRHRCRSEEGGYTNNADHEDSQKLSSLEQQVSDAVHRDIIQQRHVIVPPPPDISTNQHNNHTTQSHTTTILPILEIDNVVLSPGSTLPLRLRNPHWIEYLGNLIDDARGLFGSHCHNTTMSEVRIGILSKIQRRTKRSPREGGARTGRWRVDLIRRGVTSLPRRVENEGLEEGQSADDSAHETMQTQTESTVASSSGQSLPHREHDNDGVFHANPSRIMHSITQYNDPFSGRIGTIATIVFTHEETLNPVQVLDEDANPQRRGHSHPSFAIWRRHVDELVVTAIGTGRFRILSSCAEDVPRQGVPLYEVEELSGGNVSCPSSLMQRPGDLRCPVLFSLAMDGDGCNHVASETIDDDGENNESAADGNNVASEAIDYGDENNESADMTAGQVETEQDSTLRDQFTSDAISNLSIRSAIPNIAYRSLWPWKLSQQICTVLQQTQSFRGVYYSLPTALGVQSFNDTNTQYIRIIDNAAFANWLTSNLPLDPNDRLDILEMTNVTQQLQYLLRKIRGMAQIMLRCKYCGTVVANTCHVFTVGGAEGTTGAYVNEFGVVHQTVTVREVDERGVVAVGFPETKDSWCVL